MDTSHTQIIQQLGELLGQSGLKGRDLKDALRAFVTQHWPNLPPWTTLDAPVIEEVQKVTVGSGVVLTFNDNGTQRVVLAEAGPHYQQAVTPSYTIPGGFINLTLTPGSALVPLSEKPETARIGAAREVEEEFKNSDGSALLQIDPSRLKLMDTDTLVFPNGERRLVLGLMLELTREEVTRVKNHVNKLAVDPTYKAAVAAQTINHDSARPEVSDIKIFDLVDVAEGRCELLHKDQQSLFRIVHGYFQATRQTLTERTTPTRSYTNKVRTLDELKVLVEELRSKGNTCIGVTSGVFDLLHPGHISFLEDAGRECSHLITIVASDRTVREQKGPEKPFINELKRAQTLAAIQMVDSVIISDTPYHEAILEALKPDVMFKGNDYVGKTIFGADLVGRVVLVPCAEKDFYSSSAFVQKIKAGAPDNSPQWGPG